MRKIINDGSLIKGLHVATSGMIAQSKRLLVITQNIANAASRSDTPGGAPYARKLVRFQSYIDKKTGANLVRVKNIKTDKTPFRKIYSPGDPGADETGHVLESNVQPLIEMADMREAGRSHEAVTKAFEKILQMLQNTIGFLK
ncbi:MAG: Flagellar basal-body rod protein FlgC [Holosporales bacterium]